MPEEIPVAVILSSCGQVFIVAVGKSNASLLSLKKPWLDYAVDPFMNSIPYFAVKHTELKGGSSNAEDVFINISRESGSLSTVILIYPL